MKNALLALVCIVLFTNEINYSQELYISKVIDTNLFELNDGRTVKLYGLKIPSVNEMDQRQAILAKEIMAWETQTIANKLFEIEFEKESDGIQNINIYKQTGGVEINIATWFLAKGYAVLIDESSVYSDLVSFEEEAQKNKVGIWSDLKNIEPGNKIISQTKVNEISKKYEKPYLYMIGLSVASFAIALDYFTEAGDIQDQIDFQKTMNRTLKTNFATSSLEKAKTRKTLIGIICAAAGVATTLFAFKDVEVRTDFQSISLNVGL